MPREIKSLAQMNADSLAYLASNTDITYLSEGSLARGLVEATNSEISKVQEYIAASYANTFLNSASGYYLDLIGQMLGVKRLPVSAGSASAEDLNVQFSVPSGSLGDKFPNPGNLNQGKVPIGTKITTQDGSIVYRVSEDVVFPRNLKSVFVPVVSDQAGNNYNVGRNKLVSHNGPAGVTVTNLKPIDNADAVESDAQFRYRLTNFVASQPTGNEIAVRLAALGSADISNVVLQEFARGAGTFDALLVPVGNSVSFRSSEVIRKSIERVSAFGVSVRVKQPDYIKFKLTIQLVPAKGSALGILDVNKLNAKTAVLNYFESIRLGGELIINRLRAEIINAVTEDIKDINILELCLDGKPHVIRNVKLNATELFTPDTESEAIEIL